MRDIKGWKANSTILLCYALFLRSALQEGFGRQAGEGVGHNDARAEAEGAQKNRGDLRCTPFNRIWGEADFLDDLFFPLVFLFFDS